MRSVVILLALASAVGTARADLRVLETADVVHLHDGTEVRGTVIAVGIKAVVVIIDDKEVVIPRERVMKIVRGEVGTNVKGYATEVVEGLMRVTGPGEAGGAAVAAGPQAPATGPGPAAAQGATITKERLLQLMQSNPMLALIVKKQGGPDKALEWLEKNRSNPDVQRKLEAFLKAGQMPAGGPPPKN
jgi:hypothetical protein